jgi:hypothetical protein
VAVLVGTLEAYNRLRKADPSEAWPELALVAVKYERRGEHDPAGAWQRTLELFYEASDQGGGWVRHRSVAYRLHDGSEAETKALGKEPEAGPPIAGERVLPNDTADPQLLIRNTNPEHFSEDPNLMRPGRYDLAELIFGDAADEKGERGAKRRVSFDDARSIGDVKIESIGTVILSSPKPSFYPSYIRQSPDDQKLARLEEVTLTNGKAYRRPYVTYTPLSQKEISPKELWSREHARPEIAGFKIYPSAAVNAPSLDEFRATLENRTAVSQGMEAPGPAVQVRLQAVSRGTFRAPVRFHNLRPIELGAMLWILTFGDASVLAGGIPRYRHRLGMGKPLGMGEVKVRMLSDASYIVANQPSRFRSTDTTTLLRDAMEQFITYMNGEFASADGRAGAATWETSEQIRTLLAAAAPTVGGNNSARPYRLAYMAAEGHSRAKRYYDYLPRYLPASDNGALEHTTFRRESATSGSTAQLQPALSTNAVPRLNARARVKGAPHLQGKLVTEPKDKKSPYWEWNFPMARAKSMRNTSSK